MLFEVQQEALKEAREEHGLVFFFLKITLLKFYPKTKLSRL